MNEIWIELKPVELLALGSFWIALLILSVQARLAYLLQEKQLDERQKGRCRPETDLIRRIRLWSSCSLVGTILVIISLIKGISQESINTLLNLSSLFIGLSYLFVLVAYVKYIFFTFVIDFFASIVHVHAISIEKK